MGELGLFYRLAPIVFMGGSLVPHGGQNPIEAVKLGASIVHGPHVFNFADVYEALDRAGGARQADTQEALVKQLGQLLADPAAREVSVGGRRARGRATRRRARAHADRARAVSVAVAARNGSGQCVSRPSGTGPPSWISRLLMPAWRALWRGGGRGGMQRQGFDAGIPVLCVGNYHVGGAGKTPTVLALAKLLRELGETPVVLSRGYGGRLRGPVKVDPAAARRCRCRRRAADAGADGAGGGRARPRRRRRAGALARCQRDPDGRRLSESRDRQGCLADRDRRRPRPRQRLRVSRRSVARAAASATGPHRCADRHRRRHVPPTPVAAAIAARGKPVLSAHLRPDDASVAALRGKRVLAFAGIGDPAQVLQDAARQRHRCGPASAPSPIIIRIRKARSRPDRGCRNATR